MAGRRWVRAAAAALDAVQLAIAIEDEFNLKIMDEDIKKLATVTDALALIRNLLARKASGGGPIPALDPVGSRLRPA